MEKEFRRQKKTLVVSIWIKDSIGTWNIIEENNPLYKDVGRAFEYPNIFWDMVAEKLEAHKVSIGRVKTEVPFGYSWFEYSYTTYYQLEHPEVNQAQNHIRVLFNTRYNKPEIHYDEYEGEDDED